MRAARSQTLCFRPIPAAIRFTGCDELRDAAFSILRGWETKDVSGRRRAHPVMRLKKTRRGYRRVSRWRRTPSLAREKVRRTVVGALCGFHFELIDAYAEAHPRELCLHAAGSRFPDGLVVFPAVSRAGKSVLTTELARRGVKTFGDDVVPVDSRTLEAVSLGIVPRIRPPLPHDVEPALKRYVREHKGPGLRNRLYLALPEPVMAPCGERAPIQAIVLLERKARAKPVLEAAAPADVLETLVLQHFAELVPADRILKTFYDVVVRATCWRLRYAHVAEAAGLLVRAFGRAHSGRGSGRRAEAVA